MLYVHHTGRVVDAAFFEKVQGTIMSDPHMEIVLVTDSYGRQDLVTKEAFFSTHRVAPADAVMDEPFEPFRDVQAFHRKFGLGYDGKPRRLDDDMQTLRIALANEELTEYIDASFLAEADGGTEAEREDDYIRGMAGMLDALVDQVYVALGTADQHGFDFREAWRRVHRANMAKERCTRPEQSKRGNTLDLFKPEGWTAPCHEDLVGTLRDEN